MFKLYFIEFRFFFYFKEIIMMESPLEDMIDFLQMFEWIYNFKLTNFFIDKVWEKIPCEVGNRL